MRPDCGVKLLIFMTLEEFISEWNAPGEKLMVHTSGSTGAPKSMWVEKSRMLASARVTCDFLGLKSGDTALLCLPLDYIAGKMMVVRSLERGLRLIHVEPSNHPLAGLDEQRIDFAAMVPSQVFCSLQVPQEREVLRRVRHLIIGGGAISRELQEAIAKVFDEGAEEPWTAGSGPYEWAVWSTYGMTETLSHIALRRLNGPDASEWYTPFEGVAVSLNEDGCLVVDSPEVHDGVLVTNDLAEIENGRFRILGRRDNVICSGGVKLQIERIEDKLRPYLSVPFCITRRKDPKFGEVAVLLLADAISVLPQTQVCDAFSHLDPYEVPKAVVHVPAIPMTPNGKICRSAAEGLAL